MNDNEDALQKQGINNHLQQSGKGYNELQADASLIELPARQPEISQPIVWMHECVCIHIHNVSVRKLWLWERKIRYCATQSAVFGSQCWCAFSLVVIAHLSNSFASAFHLIAWNKHLSQSKEKQKAEREGCRPLHCSRSQWLSSWQRLRTSMEMAKIVGKTITVVLQCRLQCNVDCFLAAWLEVGPVSLAHHGVPPKLPWRHSVEQADPLMPTKARPLNSTGWFAIYIASTCRQMLQSLYLNDRLARQGIPVSDWMSHWKDFVTLFKDCTTWYLIQWNCLSANRRNGWDAGPCWYSQESSVFVRSARDWRLLHYCTHNNIEPGTSPTERIR